VLNLRRQIGQGQARIRLLEGALDTLSFPILACSAQGTIAVANAAAQQWLQQADCPLEKAIGSARLRGLLAQACGYGVETPGASSLVLASGDVVVVLPLVPQTE